MTPLATVVRTPSALYLLGTSLVGRLPSAMAALAIVQLVRLQGGDYALAGAMTAVYIVAGAVGQPLSTRVECGVQVIGTCESSRRAKTSGSSTLR
jgi:hypothetical protein